MKFRAYLAEQMKAHPVMQPQDVVKLCYQAAFGAEHLLSDVSKAKVYFEQEYEAVPAKDMALWEQISPKVCRINLRAWKAQGMPSDWLFRMFVNSASVSEGSRELFSEYLKIAEQMVEQEHMGFTLDEWKAFLEQYREAGMPAVHHSQTYRDSEYPAYRIVSSRFLRMLPVLQRAAGLAGVGTQNTVNPEGARAEEPAGEKAPKIIALDGRAASGKSTMAELLNVVLEADVVHMDDFFVPPALRSEERFAQPGGNVHYERFAEEVLPWIGKTEGFSYGIFDCGTMDYQGHREVKAAAWRVVEGSYSTHPAFGDYADLKVFLDVEAEEQIRRIVARNGEEMAQMFEKRWIPLEEAYFEACQVKEKADIVV